MGSRVNGALAAGQTKKRATRLKVIEDRIDVLAKAQIHQAESLANLGSAYNNLLGKLVKKGLLTHDDLRAPEPEPGEDLKEAEPEIVEQEPEKPGWWVNLWRSMFGAPKEDTSG